MIGIEAADLLKVFGARNWFLFSALLLKSDTAGLIEATLPELCDYTGLDRETIQRGINSLCTLRIDNRRMLRKVPARKFGANRFVLFPDRPSAPLSHIAEAEPEALTEAPPVAMPEPRRLLPRPALPLIWGDESEPLEDGPQVAANYPYLSPASSGIMPLLEGPQVAALCRYSSISKNNTNIEDDTNRTLVDPAGQGVEVAANYRYLEPEPPKADPVPKKKTARAKSSTPSASSLTGVFVDAYTGLYGSKPVGNMGILGARLKTALAGGTTPEEVAAAIAYFFNEDTPNYRYYKKRNHAVNWFIFKFAEIAAYASGNPEAISRELRNGEELRQEAGIRQLQDDATEAGEIDFLPAHLRALCDDVDDAITYGPVVTIQ